MATVNKNFVLLKSIFVLSSFEATVPMALGVAGAPEKRLLINQPVEV